MSRSGSIQTMLAPVPMQKKLARMPERAEPMRALAYRLYTLCERKGWAEDARAYNELVTAWTSIEQAAGEAGIAGSQVSLDM